MLLCRSDPNDFVFSLRIIRLQQTKSICWLHLIIRPLGLILVLLLVANVSQQHPLQQQVTIIQVNQTISRPCITDHEENGTIIIEASRDQVVPTPSSTFNERRRDMFFDDYSIKQIQVIDTSVVRYLYHIESLANLIFST